MKVQLTTPRVDAFGSYNNGAVIDVPEVEGRRMVAAGQAVAVKPERSGARVETATTGAAETAATRGGPLLQQKVSTVPMFDLHNTVKASRGISPAAAVANDTPFVSQILDTANFDSAEFVAQLGDLADADVTLTVLVEHGDAANLSDAAAAPDEDLLGIEAAALNFGSDNKTFKIGYKGTKRYLRVTITPANNTGNIFLAGIWLQGHPRTLPQSTQVV